MIEILRTSLRGVDLFFAHDFRCIARQLALDFVVVAEKFAELWMIVEIARVVHQIRIGLEFVPYLGMSPQEIVERTLTSEGAEPAIDGGTMPREILTRPAPADRAT